MLAFRKQNVYTNKMEEDAMEKGMVDVKAGN